MTHGLCLIQALQVFKHVCAHFLSWSLPEADTSATIGMSAIKTGSWRSLALRFLHISPMSYRCGFHLVFSCGFGHVVCIPTVWGHGLLSGLSYRYFYPFRGSLLSLLAVCAVLLSSTDGAVWSFHVKFSPVSLDTMLSVRVCVCVSHRNYCAIFFTSCLYLADMLTL